ncbi:LOW QUALITY PROTEIN: hypothetical protein QYF61_008761, partial [Mycteria americana]
MDGGKCPMGVARAMEADQLAVQRQTHLGCCSVVRHRYPENIAVKVHHVDAHMPKICATKEHQNNEQVDQAARTEVAQWAHKTSGHLGRDATYRWAPDREVDVTLEAITQVTHECETCAAIKGWWLGFRYGETWQIDYIGPLPLARQGKHYMLTMGLIPWESIKQISEEAKVCSHEVQDPELHHFMVTAAKAAFDLRIPNNPLL